MKTAGPQAERRLRYPPVVYRVCALALAVTAACFTKPEAPGTSDGGTNRDSGGPGGWLAGYQYRRTIIVNRPLQPLDVLSAFPLSVVIDGDGLFADHVQSAADLAFTAGDGITELPFEIVYFDEAMGDLEAWVLADRLPPGGSQFYLYYVGGVRVPQPGVVWQGAGGAWHMAGTGTLEQDSSGKVANVTTPSAATAPLSVEGVLGSSRYYDGDDYLCTPNAGALPINGPFSISLWAQPETTTNDAYDSPFSRGGNETNVGVTFELGADVWEVVVRDSESQYVNLDFSTQSDAAMFHHLAVTVDSTGSVVLYHNGQSGASSQTPGLGPFTDTHPTCIGGVNHKFKGHIDEVRFYRSALSAAWLQAEYLNIARSTRASFMSIGVEEAAQ